MKIIQLENHSLEFLDKAAQLFNAYRMFYDQESDIPQARAFLLERIEKNESKIFLAIEKEEAVGFMQLYPSFSSVGLRKIYILNDLYVEQNHRYKGIGRLLLHHAKIFVSDNHITKMTLTTAKTNTIAQQLYEDEGYVKNEAYFVYDLEL